MSYLEAVYRGPNIKRPNLVEPQPRLRFLSEKELRPFDLPIVAKLLGLYIPIPASASTYDGKRYGSDASNRNEAYLPRSTQDIKKGRLNNLLAVLGTIVDGQLKKFDLDKIKNSLEAHNIQEIFRHQASLSRQEYNQFASLIGYWYAELHQEALIKRKHIQNPFYHHPSDRKDSTRKQEEVDQQLATFTEVNVNSWSITDDQDPTIVYNSKGGASLLSSRADVPFDERRPLDFPGEAPSATQPGYKDFLNAFDSMDRDTGLEEKRYGDWVAFGEGQIRALEDRRLGGDVLEIPRSRNRVWRLIFRLGDDPREATKRLLMDPNIRRVSAQQYEEIFNGLTQRLQEESNQTGSDCWKLKMWKNDLKLRELRREISNKLQVRWRFLLQQVPPKELTIDGSRCACPTCQYHQVEPIPAGSFRLNFMDPDQHSQEQAYFLDEAVKDDPETPGRAANGQMWFCLTCVEKLFDGEELINRVGDTNTGIGSSSENLLWGTSEGKIEAAWQDRRQETLAKAFPTPVETTRRRRRNDERDNRNCVSKATKVRGDSSPNEVCRAQNTGSAFAEPSVLIPYRGVGDVGLSERSAGESIQIADEDNSMVMNDDDTSMSPAFLNADDIVEALSARCGADQTKKDRPDITTMDRARTIGIESFTTENSVFNPNLDTPTPIFTPPLETDQRESQSLLATSLAPTYPIAPRLTRRTPPDGLSPFAFVLSTFIHPEVRYTISESYTLSPQAYVGLRKWKELSTHISVLLNPQYKKFNKETTHLGDHNSPLCMDNIWRDDHGPDIIGSREINGEKLTIGDVTCPKSPGIERQDGVTSSTLPPKLKPLSEIMALIDFRTPRPTETYTKENFRTIVEREWPFHSFWKPEFEAERKRIREAKLSEKIMENEKSISKLNEEAMEVEEAEKERRRKQEDVISKLEEEAELFRAKEKMTKEKMAKEKRAKEKTAKAVEEMSISERIRMNERTIARLEREAGGEEEDEYGEEEEM